MLALLLASERHRLQNLAPLWFCEVQAGFELLTCLFTQINYFMCAVYEKRPLTQSRKPGPFSGTRSTRQCVALIHQHMNDRSKTSKTASRMVDCKHPLRALMKADVGNKGYLTHEELKECLQRNFEVLLDYDEIERVTGQFESDIPAPDGMNGFNYMAFVKSMNSMSQVGTYNDTHARETTHGWQSESVALSTLNPP